MPPIPKSTHHAPVDLLHTTLSQPGLRVQVSSCLRSPPQGESLRPHGMPWQVVPCPGSEKSPEAFISDTLDWSGSFCPTLSCCPCPSRCRLRAGSVPTPTEQSVCLFTPHGITLMHNWRFFRKRALQRIFEKIRRWLMWLTFQQFSTEY